MLAGGDDAVPGTVRDAVLARAPRLGAAARDVLAAAALLGPGSDLAVLTAVAQRPPSAVDECVEHGMLVAADRSPADTRSGTSSPARRSNRPSAPTRRRDLHRRALVELTRRDPYDHRTLAYHASGCAGPRRGAAPRAPGRASRRSARRAPGGGRALPHRAARRLTCRRHERLPLVEALGYECYLTDQIGEAVTARRQALELHQLIGDAVGVGADERWLSRLSWFAGHNEDSERYGSARRGHARTARRQS